MNSGTVTPTPNKLRIILVKTLESETNMDTIWSKQDLADAERKEVKIVYENLINPERMEQRELHSDLHIVTYEIDGDTRIDAVRAYKMVDIFDVYYDKLKTNGKVIEIVSGYGSVKPKLWDGKVPSLR